MNTLSNWIGNAVYVKKGVKLSYEGRKWMPAIFDTKMTRVLLTSRQVGKSTIGASEACARLSLMWSFNILYVAPRQDQARIYSKDKVKPIVEESPLVKRQIGRYNSVDDKEFVRGGKLYMRYAIDNPDRCRGITANMVHYDEIQDQMLELIEPVINEVMFSLEDEVLLYSGTPKSLSNPAHHKWMLSDQREFLIRCHHHSPVKYVNLKIRNIGKHGPICHHCGNLLDVDDGVWVKQNPSSDIAGFHVNQLHCKISHATPTKWKTILNKLENYSESLFLNEVMGESADSAEMPISDQLLREVCVDGLVINEEPNIKFFESGNMFAGIDWGHGQYTTALTIGKFIGATFQVLFMKVYEGEQCQKSYCLPDIAKIVNRYRCSNIHVDHGGSFGIVEDLERMVEGRVTGQMWTSSGKPTWKEEYENAHGQKVKYSVPMLSMSKTHAIAAFVARLEKKKIRLPRQEDVFAPIYNNPTLPSNKDNNIRTFAQHFLNLRKEVRVNESTAAEKVFYVRAGMDDMLQAVVYSWIIAVEAIGSILD